MSIEAVAWVLKYAPVDDPQAVLVLIGLANHAHDDGTVAFPSQKTLSSYARCCERTVRGRLADMEAAGVIRRGNQAFVEHLPANRRPVVWDLVMSLRRPLEDPAPAETGNSFRPATGCPPETGSRLETGGSRPASGATEAARHDTSARHLDADKPSFEPSLEPKRAGAYARAGVGAQGLAAPSSVPGFPPPLATVAAGIRAACRHGAPPGRCALCRGVEPSVERPVQEPVRSHAEDIRAALRQAAASS